MKKAHPEDLFVSKALDRIDLPALARRSGWLRRSDGKLSPSTFCLAMITATSVATASLRIVAFISGVHSSVAVSKQALHKRINASALGFLEEALAAAIAIKAPASRGALGFRRIVVQDSTAVSLPRRLVGVLPASGNGGGKGAGLKVHAAFDLLGRRFLGFGIREGRKPDQSFALEGGEGLGEGDLLIRDLGYFSLPAFRSLMEAGVDVLSRFKLTVVLRSRQSMDTIDLLALLRSRSEIDMEVLAGGREKLPLRLVAFRVPKEVGEQRRRVFRKTARKKGHTPGKLSLLLQDWQIYLTSCSQEQLDCDQARELYRQRWSIEILFKGFKSHMRIGEIPPFASESMSRCLVAATLLRVVLSHAVVLPSLRAESAAREVSPLKLLGLIETLGCLLENAPPNEDALITNFLKHCHYETRKRKSLPERLQCLG